MISRVSHVNIPVSDQDRALEFYTTKLGFTKTMDVPMGDQGDRWIEVTAPEGELKIVLYASPEQKEQIGKFSNVLFETKSLTATHADLSERGVTIVQPPTTEYWGSFMMFNDPDGNTFLVSGPME